MKVDYARYSFESSTVDVVCMTEAWLKNELPNNLYDFNGFELNRSDRCGRRGSGVAIYCKSGLNVNLGNKRSDDCEFLNVEIFDCSTIV